MPRKLGSNLGGQLRFKRYVYVPVLATNIIVLSVNKAANIIVQCENAACNRWLKRFCNFTLLWLYIKRLRLSSSCLRFEFLPS